MTLCLLNGSFFSLRRSVGQILFPGRTRFTRRSWTTSQHLESSRSAASTLLGHAAYACVLGVIHLSGILIAWLTGNNTVMTSS